MGVIGCIIKDELCCVLDVLKELLNVDNDGGLVLLVFGGIFYYLK